MRHARVAQAVAGRQRQQLRAPVGTIQFDDLQSRRGYQPWRAYGQVGATHSRGLGRPGSMQGLPTAPKRLTEATGSIAARYARTAALHASDG